MTERLMSPERHSQLMKVAAECIGLMNIGVDGDSAMAKLADDNLMTDNEVELVTTAVNNGKQLAHLQSSEPDDRDKTFPLLSSEKVKSKRDQPTTNADVNTGSRYGSQEELAESTAAKQDAPDAQDIKADLQKAASASYSDEGVYFDEPERPDYAAILKQACAVGDPTLPDYQDADKPWRDLDDYRVVLDEARTKYASAYGKCLSVLDSLAYDLNRLDAPSFDRIETAAKLAGATPDLLDIVYAQAGLCVKRAEATPERLYVSKTENAYVQRILEADALWKEAAAVMAAREHFEREYADKLAKLAKKDDDSSGGGSGSDWWGAKMEIDPEKTMGELSELPGSLTPGEEVRDALAPAGDVPPLRSVNDVLSPGEASEMSEISTRSRLQNLMANDDYIASHNIADVIDAYNAAMSVNPNFGDAELVSYIRQHLGSSGSVPLDIQLRAAGPRQGEDD